MGLPTCHDPVMAVGQVLYRLEEALVGKGVDGDGFFGNHPLPLTEFLAGMEALGEPRDGFLDLGCGLGTKLALGHFLGWSGLVGVEHNSHLVHAARDLVPEARIVRADALGFDCSGFSVVYTYRLCQNLAEQERLGHHIAHTADPGTLVFYAGADMPVGEPVSESVWRV